MRQADSQSGNALFFILIAIALLVGLTFVMTRSASDTNQTGNVEQARIKMSQVVRYAKGLETGVQQLIIRGCSENEISFENDVDPNYTNPNSPADRSCHVFDAAGAGLAWQEFGEDLAGANSSIGFINSIYINGIENNTTPAGNDLIIVVNLGQSVCEQINKDLGLSVTPADIQMNTDVWDDYYIGTFATNEAIGLPGRAPALQGQTNGCVLDDGGHYIFYNVLLAR